MENTNSTLTKSSKDIITAVSEGVQFTSLHHIDHIAGVITPININNKSEALLEYIERLLADIKEKHSKRSFEFKSETTEVRTAIKLMIEGNFQEAVNINARRLLEVEKETQLSMDKLGISIQKGSLFQTIINVDSNTKMIIIGKADHNDFLDASDFIVHKGLPWKKKIFKSFLVITDNIGNILKILVSDTTNAVTKYWWSDFFELKEERTDQYNTRKFIDLLDKKIFNPIKKKYPADHTTLRNSVIGYLRSNTEFDLENLFENLFRDYRPVANDFPKDEINRKLNEIPDKFNIDSQFTIDKNEIDIRSVNKIFLNEGMELVLNGSPDLNKISSFKDDEKNKFIAIRTDEGYDRFNKPE